MKYVGSYIKNFIISFCIVSAFLDLSEDLIRHGFNYLGKDQPHGGSYIKTLQYLSVLFQPLVVIKYWICQKILYGMGSTTSARITSLPESQGIINQLFMSLKVFSFL